MSNGCWANFAEVISDKALAGIVGKELSSFIAALDASDMSEQDFVLNDYTDTEHPIIQETYIELVDAFLDVTGLELCLQYHNKEDQGDIYDDVDGAFWSVDGVYEYTEAGNKWSDVIERKFYVAYG